MSKLNLKKAKAIKGWTWPKELVWLGKTAKKADKIIEVGSYRGRSTRAMLDNSKAHIWCIDSWNTLSNGYTGNISISDYTAFKTNIKDMLERVTILKMMSDKGAKQLLDLYGRNSFDMVFIDGGHSYKIVKADILAYTPLLRVGGILCGHDYPTWPGVKKAVDELIKDFKLVKSIWWTTC